MRNLVEATPDSSQCSSLVEADNPAIPEDSKQRWGCVKHFHELEAFLLGRGSSGSGGALEGRGDGLGEVASD